VAAPQTRQAHWIEQLRVRIPDHGSVELRVARSTWSSKRGARLDDAIGVEKRQSSGVEGIDTDDERGNATEANRDGRDEVADPTPPRPRDLAIGRPCPLGTENMRPPGLLGCRTVMSDRRLYEFGQR